VQIDFLFAEFERLSAVAESLKLHSQNRGVKQDTRFSVRGRKDQMIEMMDHAKQEHKRRNGSNKGEELQEAVITRLHCPEIFESGLDRSNSDNQYSN
jgi:hypothetical protein